MKRSPLPPAIVGTLLVVGSGIVHGMWTGRWSPTDSNQLVARIDSIPKQIGDWECVSEGLISEDAQDLAELKGYSMRFYRNRRTGQSVSLLLMCGAPGPVAVHPPTACYAGQGFEQVGKVENALVSVHRSQHRPDTTISNANKDQASGSAEQIHAFQRATFRKPGFAELSNPRIYWAWTTDGYWQVPERPRMAFAGQPILFKLYVTSEVRPSANNDGLPVEEEFLAEVIPALRGSIWSDSRTDSRATFGDSES